MKESGDLLRIRGSRKIYFPLYLMIFILIVAFAYAKFSGKEVNLLALKLAVAFSSICLLFTEIHRLGSLYEINSNSLISTKGIFSKTERRVDLVSISDADSKQSLWQRILNYGNVRARLFSKESTTWIKNINNPSHFADFLEKKMNEKKSGQGSPI